jgi:Uncharacterized protein conserved in bacteria (DUF2252)
MLTPILSAIPASTDGNVRKRGGTDNTRLTGDRRAQDTWARIRLVSKASRPARRPASWPRWRPTGTSLPRHPGDPVGRLLGQAESRVPELVPVRHGRMLTSPFAYYRGAALPMAADLAGTRSCRLRPQVCGDAHLLNFGAFASPERRLAAHTLQGGSGSRLQRRRRSQRGVVSS